MYPPGFDLADDSRPVFAFPLDGMAVFPRLTPEARALLDGGATLVCDFLRMPTLDRYTVQRVGIRFRN